MERLTIKNSDGSYSQPTDTTFYEIFNKHGELEDVLEKYGIENAEELDGVLKPLIDNGELENWKGVIFWKTQTERLAQELVELKQQLHDLPKKIVEEIRDVAGDYWDFNICEECGNVPDLNILTMKDFNEILDAILEEYGGEDE